MKITLKSHFCLEKDTILSFCMQYCYGRHYIMLLNMCLSILIHVVSLQAQYLLYDKFIFWIKEILQLCPYLLYRLLHQLLSTDPLGTGTGVNPVEGVYKYHCKDSHCPCSRHDLKHRFIYGWTLCPLGNFSWFLLSADCFKIKFFEKFFQE